MRPGTADTVRADPRSAPPPIVDAAIHKKRRLQPASTTRNAPLTSFFLRREDDLDRPTSSSSRNATNSTSAVANLEDASNPANAIDCDRSGDSEVKGPHELSVFAKDTQSQSLSQESQTQHASTTSSSTKFTSQSTSLTPSAKPSMIPIFPITPHSPSADSDSLGTPRSVSLRSFRLEDDDVSIADETGSQAVASSDESDDHDQQEEQQADRRPGEEHSPATSEAPQLVMPSIKMPKRRPFTEKGKHMGKLKIMVLGGEGCGKTSLIRSMVQLCEDVVHVDPLTTTSPHILPTSSHPAQKVPRRPTRTSSFTEIHASTRSYPDWWSDAAESRILRRRSSFNEGVLERNICFIDTPGFTDLSSFNPRNETIIRHVEDLLHNNLSLASLSDHDILNIFSGQGGVQIDLVLYILSNPRTCIVEQSLEMDFIQRLSRITNVLPIVGKSDLYSPCELSETLSPLLGALASKNITPFLANQSLQEMLNSKTLPLPYAVSSAISDDDNMDASLLMSSGYIEPLIQSDLPRLVTDIFNPDTTARLRHSAAKKFLHWRKTSASNVTSHPIAEVVAATPHNPTTLSSIFTTSMLGTSPSPSAILVNYRARDSSANGSDIPYQSYQTSPASPASPYTQALVADHTQREERLAQVHLARWASDLQRALQNERARFSAIQEKDRTAWLQERMQECISNESEQEKGVLISPTRKSALVHRRLSRVNPRDPLGLMEWHSQLKENGVMALKMLGGASIVGAMLILVMKECGWSVQVRAWEFGWSQE